MATGTAVGTPAVTSTSTVNGITTVTNTPASGIDPTGNVINKLLGKWGKVKDSLWVQYPSATVNFKESSGNAEELANPQIRVLNNKPAKILIGSRIPIQTSTATGSALTGAVSTFEYRDIGIKLTVEPDIGLGDDVKLKTTLEVSSLGEP